MADSPTVDNGGLTDYVVSSDEVTIDGTLGQVQRIKIVDGTNAGTELVAATAANGLDVDVTRLPALVAGTANIGDVDIASIAAGTTAIGAVYLGGTTHNAATGTKSNVSASATSVTVLAQNTSRKGYIVFNDSTSVCYLDCSGGTASATSFSVRLDPYDTYELFTVPMPSPALTGIWTTATGSMRVTEFT